MPVQRPWQYSVNPMLTVTDGSFRLAIRISAFHLARLKTKAGTPVYDAMIAKYDPLHQQLMEAYNQWKQQGGSQLGQTLDFTNLLLLLRSSKIKKWDIAIQGVYDDTTPQYKALLPKGRILFQTGKQTEILSAVKVLADATAADPKLAGFSAEIKEFYSDLQKAFDSQKESIGNTSLFSEMIEKARVGACVGMFANLGGIIQDNPTDPDAICYFFDQLAIREGTQVIYNGSIKQLTFKNILVHTYAAGDKMLLENEGLTEEWFYLGAQKDAKPGDKYIKVLPGEKITVAAEELGGLANRFLNVYNPNADMKGEWTVEFV